MKWKKIAFISVIILAVFLIYLLTIDRKIFYLDMGDQLSISSNSYGVQLKEHFSSLGKLEKYVDGFKKDDLRITDIMRMIETNEKVLMNEKEQTIKNALIKADLLTLSVGLNDFTYKIDYVTKAELYDIADEVLYDLEDLFVIIREYCKEDIVYIGIPYLGKSEFQEVFDYLNEKIELLCNDYKIKFVPTSGSVSFENGVISPVSSSKIYDRIKLGLNHSLLK